MTATERAAAVLADHYRIWAEVGEACGGCDWTGGNDEHPAHVAELLAAAGILVEDDPAVPAHARTAVTFDEALRNSPHPWRDTTGAIVPAEPDGDLATLLADHCCVTHPETGDCTGCECGLDTDGDGYAHAVHQAALATAQVEADLRVRLADLDTATRRLGRSVLKQVRADARREALEEAAGVARSLVGSPLNDEPYATLRRLAGEAGR